MNDRFKFRAWHSEAQQMLYPHVPFDAFHWLKEGQPVEIMQFTGLKDKHGKDVYEGDIVQAYQGYVECREFFVIKYLGRSYSMEYPDETENESGLGNIWFFNFEILGNIYENPELILK